MLGSPKRSSSSIVTKRQGRPAGRTRASRGCSRPAQILIGTCGERAVYGTVGTHRAVLPRMEGALSRSPPSSSARGLGELQPPQDILLYGLLEPRNLLDIVRNFVAFEVEGGRIRPQAHPVQAVHGRERGDAPDRNGAGKRADAGRSGLAHTRIREEPHDAVARAEAPPRPSRSSIRPW